MLKYIFTSLLLAKIKSETCSQRQFEQISTLGPSLPPHETISAHHVVVQAECLMHCLRDAESCGGFNYRAADNAQLENCQLSYKNKSITVGVGEWAFYQDVELAVKTEANCGNPGSPSGGYTSGSSYTYGSQVTFHCNSGLTLRGSASATCMADSTWSNPTPKCVTSQLRLTGSAHSDRGQVEMYRSGYGWYTFCDHSWDIKDAKVICRELGFTGAKAVHLNAHYNKGSTSRIMDIHPNCKGNEASIKKCPMGHYLWRPYCGLSDNVGVHCAV